MSVASPPPVPLSDGLDTRPCQILDPPLKHYYSRRYTEKNDVIFSKRQASIQSEVGPVNPAVWSGGALWTPPEGSRAEPRPKSNIWNTVILIPKSLWFKRNLVYNLTSLLRVPVIRPITTDVWRVYCHCVLSECARSYLTEMMWLTCHVNVTSSLSLRRTVTVNNPICVVSRRSWTITLNSTPSNRPTLLIITMSAHHDIVMIW